MLFQPNQKKGKENIKRCLRQETIETLLIRCASNSVEVNQRRKDRLQMSKEF